MIRIFIETKKKKKMELQSATWSDYKHHNTDELLVCVFPNSTITLAYNIIADNSLTLFGECAAECVHLSPQEKECTSSA